MDGKTSSYEQALMKAKTCLRRIRFFLEENEKAANEFIKEAKQRTRKNLQKISITLDDLDKLNIIHVTGTKGKGSTCFYCESILRHCGYKTGLLISPQVVEVRERIQIEGVPVSKEKFSETFNYIYNVLDKTNKEDEMPTPQEMYFLMAMKIFLKEKIDVMILEVGIGGEYDYTNVIQNPIICGITSIGIDHITMLGDTIEEIAWHKGGIMKKGALVITCSQKEEVLTVLKLRAFEKGVCLKVAPDLDVFEKDQCRIELGIKGQGSRINAALALQLCNAWIQRMKTKNKNANPNCHHVLPNEMEDAPGILESFPLTDQILSGLRECSSLTVCRTIKKTGVTYYMDSAHTTESMQVCADWFNKSSMQECEERRVKAIRCLLFLSGRNPVDLLSILSECRFDFVIFLPQKLYPDKESPADLNDLYFTVPESLVDVGRNIFEGEKPISFCTYNWTTSSNKFFSDEYQEFLKTNTILRKENKKAYNEDSINQEIETKISKPDRQNKKPQVQTKEAKDLKDEKIHATVKKFDDVQTCLIWIRQLLVKQSTDQCKDVDLVQVLVTGGCINGHVLYLLDKM